MTGKGSRIHVVSSKEEKMEEFLKDFFEVHSVTRLDGDRVRVSFRGVSRGNFKEFFTAILEEGDAEGNIQRLSKALKDLREFEESSWEERLE